jgi:hypothetical protein
VSESCWGVAEMFQPSLRRLLCAVLREVSCPKSLVGDLSLPEEAIAADSLAAMASRHDDLVDAKVSPEFDTIVGSQIRRGPVRGFWTIG